ncbi:MAG: hypothetical protein Q8J88_11805 [Bacteroidales bacterium]|nr:hypothetical protein [Bacteroidales bacterium]
MDDFCWSAGIALPLCCKRKMFIKDKCLVVVDSVIKGVPYNNPAGYLFLDQKRKLGLVKRIKKQIDKFGLTNEELGISIC